MTVRDSPYGAFNLVALALLAALLLAPQALSIDTEGERVTAAGHALPSLCLRSRVFHEPCRTCGLGRSVVALLHGERERSVAFHSGGVWLVGLVAAQLVARMALLAIGAGSRFILMDALLSSASFLAVCLRVAAL